jgi:hypothetical protein
MALVVESGRFGKVLRHQVSHLLLKYTRSGYGTVLTAACARFALSIRNAAPRLLGARIFGSRTTSRISIHFTSVICALRREFRGRAPKVCVSSPGFNFLSVGQGNGPKTFLLTKLNGTPKVFRTACTASGCVNRLRTKWTDASAFYYQMTNQGRPFRLRNTFGLWCANSAVLQKLIVSQPAEKVPPNFFRLEPRVFSPKLHSVFKNHLNIILPSMCRFSN